MASVTVPLNLRNFSIMVLKNAVNAALLAGIQIYHDPADNNLKSLHGLKGVAWIVGSAIIAREGVILIPRLLKWSQTNGNGAAPIGTGTGIPGAAGPQPGGPTKP